MIIGEANREHELECNPVKQKQLSNVRAVNKEDKIVLTPPVKMSLERLIAYVQGMDVADLMERPLRGVSRRPGY